MACGAYAGAYRSTTIITDGRRRFSRGHSEIRFSRCRPKPIPIERAHGVRLDVAPGTAGPAKVGSYVGYRVRACNLSIHWLGEAQKGAEKVKSQSRAIKKVDANLSSRGAESGTGVPPVHDGQDARPTDNLQSWTTGIASGVRPRNDIFRPIHFQRSNSRVQEYGKTDVSPTQR